MDIGTGGAYSSLERTMFGLAIGQSSGTRTNRRRLDLRKKYQ